MVCCCVLVVDVVFLLFSPLFNHCLLVWIHNTKHQWPSAKVNVDTLKYTA